MRSEEPKQARYCDLTIQLQQYKGVDEPKAKISEVLERLAKAQNATYALAFHDRDFYNEEDESKDPSHKQGSAKGLHCHVVWCGNKECKKRHSEWLSLFTEELSEYVTPTAINVCCIGAVLLEKKTRYLLHWNKADKDAGKYVYQLADLITNDMEFFTRMLSTQKEKDQKDFILLTEAVENAECVTDLVKALGVSTYSQLRWVIQDLWKDKQERERKNPKDLGYADMSDRVYANVAKIAVKAYSCWLKTNLEDAKRRFSPEQLQDLLNEQKATAFDKLLEFDETGAICDK